MARTVSTQENHARYERALARSSGKRQVKGISPTRPQKTQEFALRHQAHASPEQLTQTVLDAVSMYSQLKKLQLDGRNTKKLLRKIMARNAKDLAFSQFYKVCEDFHDWEKAIDFLNSRPEDVELNVRLAFIARQIINQTIPTPTPTENPAQTIPPSAFCIKSQNNSFPKGRKPNFGNSFRKRITKAFPFSKRIELSEP